MSKVWLVTGSGSGLGRNLAKLCSHRAIASSQRPAALANSKTSSKSREKRVRTAPRDVAHESAAHACCRAGGGAHIWTSRCHREQRGLRRCCTVRAVKLGEIQGHLASLSSPLLMGLCWVTTCIRWTRMAWNNRLGFARPGCFTRTPVKSFPVEM
jgi:hypothetical protein